MPPDDQPLEEPARRRSAGRGRDRGCCGGRRRGAPGRRRRPARRIGSDLRRSRLSSQRRDSSIAPAWTRSLALSSAIRSSSRLAGRCPRGLGCRAGAGAGSGQQLPSWSIAEPASRARRRRHAPRRRRCRRGQVDEQLVGLGARAGPRGRALDLARAWAEGRGSRPCRRRGRDDPAGDASRATGVHLGAGAGPRGRPHLGDLLAPATGAGNASIPPRGSAPPPARSARTSEGFARGWTSRARCLGSSVTF